MITNDEDHISKGDGQRRLGQPARAQGREEQGDSPTGDIADRKTTAELAGKGDEPVHRVRGAISGQHRDSQRVDRDCRGVVEQALALHQGRQATRRTDVVEDPHHRNRIGGRDDRAQNDAGQDPDRGNGPQGKPDDKGADDHPDDGEKENRPDLVAELAHVDIERRLEQQRRQKNIEERLGAEPEIVEPAYDIADDIPGMRRQGEVGGTPDRDPHYGKQDGIRN